MSHITVNDEQAALIAASNGTLQVHDTQSRLIGYLMRWPSAGEVPEAKARLRHIVVDAEQAVLIARSIHRLEVRDHQGRSLGYLTPGPSDEELAKLKARLAVNQPTYTTAEVLEHLRSLERQ